MKTNQNYAFKSFPGSPDLSIQARGNLIPGAPCKKKSSVPVMQFGVSVVPGVLKMTDTP